MFREFKEFIQRGNVLELAVGIIIGAAFTDIVNSLVENIISPLIGLLIGGIDFSGLSFGVGDAQILYGSFIQAVINFFIIAWVVFLIVKAYNSAMARFERKEAAEDPEVLTKQETLLIEIRDLLATRPLQR